MFEKVQRTKWPDDTAERITNMRSMGQSWLAIAISFGTHEITVRSQAKKLGVFLPSHKFRFFTAEEDSIIREDYLAQVDLQKTAEKLGRSYGDLRQRIHRKHRDILQTVRTTASTKAIKKYGLGLLEHGATPAEAAENIKAKIIAAKAAARVAAINAKTTRHNEIVSIMVEQIGAGKDRNAAIFEARSLGLTLERISECFELTRERVRQICDAEAFRMTMDAAIKQDESPVTKRDFLIVSGGNAA